VFVNGFTLEGAIAVGDGENLDELKIFDVLASLVDKSLVLAEPKGDALRYRILESTHVYAGEKLAAAGERDIVADRHLRFLRERFAALRAYAERTARIRRLCSRTFWRRRAERFPVGHRSISRSTRRT
jgi:predicted ATPase